jgi:adenylate cyclase class 2
MKTEYEAKFVGVDIKEMRERLINVGATCVKPMRTMRRVAIDSDFMRDGKDSFLRVRDEGDKVTMTYKQFDDLSVDGAKEIEVEVSDYEATVALLAQAGLPAHTQQETRRETWQFEDIEIMIDEWPWLEPYIEIESDDPAKVERFAEMLGFNWDDAIFGDVMAAYRVQYPHLLVTDTVATIAEVTFGAPLPGMLEG